MTADTLVLTLIDADGQRQQPTLEVQADAQHPHTLLPHILQLAAINSLTGGDYEAEVALRDTGPDRSGTTGQLRILYALRCM